MLFFPYKIDLDLHRIPFVTFFVCLLCLLLYSYQFSTDWRIKQAAIDYCQYYQRGLLELVIEKVTGEKSTTACASTLQSIRLSAAPDKVIYAMAQGQHSEDRLDDAERVSLINEVLHKHYDQFQKNTIGSFTAELIYEPRSFRIDKMITAAFAHASWIHLLGNLFFFFAFAAAVEILIGSVSFVIVIICLAIGTNLAYSIVTFNEPLAPATLGLSGVVMGMIGLFTFLIPTAKIRCFFWFLLIVRRWSISAWILAMWYVGWDVYHLYRAADNSNINLIAHVSGALFGVGLGLVFFRKNRPGVTHKKRLRRVA